MAASPTNTSKVASVSGSETPEPDSPQPREDRAQSSSGGDAHAHKRKLTHLKTAAQAQVATHRVAMESDYTHGHKCRVMGLRAWLKFRWDKLRKYNDQDIPAGLIHPNSVFMQNWAYVICKTEVKICVHAKLNSARAYVMVASMGWYVLYVPYEIGFLTDRVPLAADLFSVTCTLIVVITCTIPPQGSLLSDLTRLLPHARRCVSTRCS
jgi:hypothetical protein